MGILEARNTGRASIVIGKLGTEQAEAADLERQISIRLERGVCRGVWSLTDGILSEAVNGQRVA